MVQDSFLNEEGLARFKGNIDTTFATKYRKQLVTLPTTGWVGDNPPYSIDLSITGVLPNSAVQITPILDMTLEQLDAWESLRLYAGQAYYGYITLKANGFKPNVEIPLEVLIGSEIIEATVEEITE